MLNLMPLDSDSFKYVLLPRSLFVWEVVLKGTVASFNGINLHFLCDSIYLVVGGTYLNKIKCVI